MRDVVFRSGLLLLIASAAIVGGCRHAGPAIRISEIDITLPDGPVRGFVAEVDLAHPSVDIVVTDPLAKAPAENVDGLLTPTDQWAEQVGATLAVNANFFAIVDGPKRWTDIVGLSVSDGRVASTVRIGHDGQPDPSLVIMANGRAAVMRPEVIDASMIDAVSSVGTSPTATHEDQWLVTSGHNTGDKSRVAPSVRHPRTAVGVKDDGRTLVILVVDGRQPDWSIGVTLPELADMMIERGVIDAINLDGGGSSSFVYRDAASGEVIEANRPSDGEFRAVANHLGVRLRVAAD